MFRNDEMTNNFQLGTVLRKMKPGETYYVFNTRAGFTQKALCEFIGIERGRVKGKVIHHTFPQGHKPFEDMAAGSVITAMAKKCLQWGQGENDLWPRCHWFKTLDEPLK
tara:strand:- start:1787 stop:2113 length:327 start_codon:yes stop_codon:yes gene_type:complete